MKIVKTTNKLGFTLLDDGSISIYLALLDLSFSNDTYSRVELLIDTGASTSVLSLGTVLSLGYKRLGTGNYTIVSTFAGRMKCYDYEIPSFRLAGDLLVDKPIVWVPEGSYRAENLLGQDILAEYNYYVDNDDSCMYFESKVKNS